MPACGIERTLDTDGQRLATTEAGDRDKSFPELCANVFRSTSESIWLLDESGRTLWANERLSVLLGKSREDLVRSNFLELMAGDAAAESFRLCCTDRSEQRFEISFAGPETITWVSVRLFPFHGSYADSSSPVLAMITDVTREREAGAVLLRAARELDRRVRGEGSAGDGVASDPGADRERLLGLAAQIVAANKELEAFSYSVSHDLRAPLRSIDGFSRILIERYGPSLDELGRDYLRRVRAAAQKMGLLITDMLTLARVARAEMSSEPVNITEIARSICCDLADSDRDRHVEVMVSDDLTTVGDPRLLGVVLTNLLDNAWKFTGKRDDARVEVTRAPSETDDVFRISDNGAGFEMKYVEKLFRPFQRLHTDADFLGTGVGLATVQRIIARHGGRVWAEAAVGDGARVFFSIPREQVARVNVTERSAA